MVGKTARTLQGVGWIPITPLDIGPPYWMGLWLGIFPTVETIVAQIAAALFVVGSYVLAERLRTHGRRRVPPASGTPATTAPPATSGSSNGRAHGSSALPDTIPRPGERAKVKR